jgi:hypothetical protein
VGCRRGRCRLLHYFDDPSIDDVRQEPMTMNSAQRLQREATQSQAVNSNARVSARSGGDAGLIPTQILEPTQRVSQVRLS